MLATTARGKSAAAVGVRLFGGVRVVRDGEQVAPPPGAPSALLRMVAACGAVHLEELAEALWPESPAGAHAVLERAGAALAALGLTPSPALQEVRRALSRGETG